MVALLISECLCMVSWFEHDPKFDLAVVTLTFKILSRPCHGTISCRKFILGSDIGWAMLLFIVMV